MTESPDIPWAKSDDDRIKKPSNILPSRAAVFLYNYLKSKNVDGGRMVDLGCGNGRNSIFFAKMGFEVHAVDKSDEVLKDLDMHGVMPHCHSVTEFWLFEDGYFDIAMDIFCYCYQPEDKKTFYRSELLRVLRERGTYLLSVPESTIEEIRKEFGEFEIADYESNTDTVDGRFVKTTNVIMIKK